MPTVLRPGDTVAVISPSSGAAALHPRRVTRAVRAMENRLGLRVRMAPRSREISGWTAGSVDQRIADLHESFADPNVAGILCSIGGDHCAQLLHRLDLDLVRAHPKVFCGYSDATVLHHALYGQVGLRTFHGPSLLMEFGEWPEPFAYTLEHFRRATMSTEPLGAIAPSEWYVQEFLDWADDESRPRQRRPAYSRTALRPGEAEGPALAGCLPTCTQLLGTLWQPSYDGTVFFLDIPDAYRPADADRDLWHLRNAGVLDDLAALVVARAPGETPAEIELLHRSVEQATEHTSYPVIAGLDAGHTDPMVTLPLGVRVRISDTEVTVLEPGVRP
ncbi:LD-carboxypeptidase [Saccharothrix sp. AJ9571]|nr:LD-carboxypeptidase [Saccharothrix sp. AJ9571]